MRINEIEGGIRSAVTWAKGYQNVLPFEGIPDPRLVDFQLVGFVHLGHREGTDLLTVEDPVAEVAKAGVDRRGCLTFGMQCSAPKIIARLYRDIGFDECTNGGRGLTDVIDGLAFLALNGVLKDEPDIIDLVVEAADYFGWDVDRVEAATKRIGIPELWVKRRSKG